MLNFTVLAVVSVPPDHNQSFDLADVPQVVYGFAVTCEPSGEQISVSMTPRGMTFANNSRDVTVQVTVYLVEKIEVEEAPPPRTTDPATVRRVIDLD